MTITDLYKTLFGRKGIADGTVIDMAEHGRTGGVSTGTSFKGVQEIPLALIVDEVDSTTTYLGEANYGTVSSSASWRIRKISVSGVVTTIAFADGNANFDNIWNDRAGLSYS